MQLGPQAALVVRLLELHLDARQKVPSHWAGDGTTHHHGCSGEVDLTSQLNHIIPIGVRGSDPDSGPVINLTSDLQVRV